MLRSVSTDAGGVFRLTGLTISDTVQVVGGVPDLKGALLSFDAPGVNFPRPPAVATPGWLTGDSFLADARLRQTAWARFLPRLNSPAVS